MELLVEPNTHYTYWNIARGFALDKEINIRTQHVNNTGEELCKLKVILM